MPQFYPAETKTARTTMRNPTAREFSYAAAIILGVPEIARSEVSVSIPAGEEKQVSFPVTIPSQTGVYPVHISVDSEGRNIGIYRATEDLEVVSWRWQYVLDLRAQDSNVDYRVRVTNPGPDDTRTVTMWIRGAYIVGWEWRYSLWNLALQEMVTLQSGRSLLLDAGWWLLPSQTAFQYRITDSRGEDIML